MSSMMITSVVMSLTDRERSMLAFLAGFPPHVWVREGTNAHICASLVRKGHAERYHHSERVRGEPRVSWMEYRATALGREAV